MFSFFNCRHSSLVSICTVPHESSHLRQSISIHIELSSGYSHSRIETCFRFHIITQLREWMTLNAEIRIPGKTIFCRRILRVHPSSTAVVSIIEAYVDMDFPVIASDRYTNTFIDHVQSVQKYYKIRSEILYILSVLLVSIVVSIPACHAGDRGSIPRRGALFFLHLFLFGFRIAPSR